VHNAFKAAFVPAPTRLAPDFGQAQGWLKKFHPKEPGRPPTEAYLLDRVSLNKAARLGLAAKAGRRVFRGMAKPRVTFKMQRIAEDDWQILAEYPGVEPRYIKGLKSKAEVDEWLQGTRRIDWLRSQGYAK
jgi:hypothetical protein